MNRLLAAVVLAVVVLLAVPGPHAHAQGPTEVPAARETEDDARPWGRLFIFVPLSIALGAGAVYGRRLARDRGWFGS